MHQEIREPQESRNFSQPNRRGAFFHWNIVRLIKIRLLLAVLALLAPPVIVIQAAGAANALPPMTLVASVSRPGLPTITSAIGLKLWVDDQVTMTAIAPRAPQSKYEGVEFFAGVLNSTPFKTCYTQTCTYTGPPIFSYQGTIYALFGDTRTMANDWTKRGPTGYVSESNDVSLNILPRPSVTVTATPNLGSQQPDNVTVTSNESVNGSPYVLRVYDSTAQVWRDCPPATTNTTCTLTMNETATQTHEFGGTLILANGYYILASTPHVFTTWGHVPDAAGLTATSTGLTATSYFDVGDTAYWIQFYNAETDTKLPGSCYDGDSCTITPPGCGDYVVMIARWSASLPAADTQTNSPTVHWCPPVVIQPVH